MKFQVNQKIFEKYPEVVIGVVVARNIDNGRNLDEVAKMIEQEQERIRGTFSSETLSQEPKISAWREAYRSFGVKPGDAKSSVESLYKIVLRGNNIRQINSLVDIYNYISLKYMLPIGGEDIDKMTGDLRLTFANNEKPVKLLGDTEVEFPIDGEVIYKDDNSTICRRWNWREADRTKLTEGTENAILVIEGIPPVSQNDIEIAINDLSNLVFKYCGGKAETYLIDIGSGTITL